MTKCQSDDATKYHTVTTMLQDYKVSKWQSDKMTKCQSVKVSKCLSEKVTRWQGDKVSKWQFVKVTICHIVTTIWQGYKCQSDKVIRG